MDPQINTYNRFLTIDDKVYLGLGALLCVWNVYLCFRIGLPAPSNFILYSLFAFMGVLIWSSAVNVQIRRNSIWILAIGTAILLATPFSIVGVVLDFILIYRYGQQYFKYGVYLNDKDGFRLYIQRKRDEEARRIATDQYNRGIKVLLDSKGNPLRPLTEEEMEDYYDADDLPDK